MTRDNGLPTTQRMRRLLLTALVAAGVIVTTGATLAGALSCAPGITCYGSDSPDTFDGTAGDEWVIGNGGDDVFSGGAGHDSLAGDGQADSSHDGDDTLSGGAGPDSLYGYGGNDHLLGGGGNDVIAAIEGGGSNNPGEDSVKGGKGNDIIHADDGFKDTIDCGPGKDEVTFDAGLDKVAANCEKRHPV